MCMIGVGGGGEMDNEALWVKSGSIRHVDNQVLTLDVQPHVQYGLCLSVCV